VVVLVQFVTIFVFISTLQNGDPGFLLKNIRICNTMLGVSANE